jgi:metallophosphoesterase (TIGR00282 family)
MKTVKALMIGDVIGEPGLEILESRLPEIIKEHQIDFTSVNGENIADGFGMTESGYKRILASGADIVTSGNHVWEKRDFLPVLDNEERILRPANYPGDSPGIGWTRIIKNEILWVVINLQGREFMNPIDCPFRCFDSILNSAAGIASDNHSLVTKGNDNPVTPFPFILVDFHAESPREKESLGYYIDGRASVVAGTHTHVQTADERILPKGTAYITDLGMTGIVQSVIGMDPKICLDRMRKQVLYRMEIARNAPASVQGIIAEIDVETGKAVGIKRIQNEIMAA